MRAENEHVRKDPTLQGRRMNAFLPRMLSSIFPWICAMVLGGMAWGITTKPSADLAAELSDILRDQTACWNQGDIDGFMNAYWRNEKLTFASGGEVERGWDATLARYKRRYPDSKTMGKLTFSKLEVQSLGDEAALMLGRRKLERENPIEGNFTLVWQKLDGQWKIIHDHTSKGP